MVGITVGGRGLQVDIATFVEPKHMVCFAVFNQGSCLAERVLT